MRKLLLFMMCFILLSCGKNDLVSLNVEEAAEMDIEVEEETVEIVVNEKENDEILEPIVTMAANEYYQFRYASDDAFVTLTIPEDEWLDMITFNAYGMMPNQNSRGMKDSQKWTNFIYEHVSDEYQFIVYVLNVDKRPKDLMMNGYYQGIKNDTVGIGTSYVDDPFYDFSKLYGSKSLEGIIYITHNDVVYDGPFLHELLHRYGNYILDSDEGCHWGRADIYGRLGGYDVLEDMDDKTCVKTYRRYWSGPYAPFELYLMGLLPKEEVPDITVLEDYSNRIVDETEWDRRTGQDVIVKDPIQSTTYTIDEIINGACSRDEQKKNIGERIPNYYDASHNFNVLFVSVDIDEMTDVEVESMNEQVKSLCLDAANDDGVYNFYEATGSRGCLLFEVILKNANDKK